MTTIRKSLLTYTGSDLNTLIDALQKAKQAAIADNAAAVDVCFDEESVSVWMEREETSEDIARRKEAQERRKAALEQKKREREERKARNAARKAQLAGINERQEYERLRAKFEGRDHI